MINVIELNVVKIITISLKEYKKLNHQHRQYGNFLVFRGADKIKNLYFFLKIDHYCLIDMKV